MAENNINNNGETAIPSQFSHSVKLEQTAKGVRITVHVSADNAITARQEAIDMYVATQAELRDKGIEIAQIEVKT
jgi:hypothetical protein